MKPGHSADIHATRANGPKLSGRVGGGDQFAEHQHRRNGQFDAGKIRSIKRALLCVQVLLKSYGVELAKLKPVAAESRIIFYFGVRSIPRPWSLVREELDDHFGFPVVKRIEEANEYFRTKLHQLLETP